MQFFIHAGRYLYSFMLFKGEIGEERLLQWEDGEKSDTQMETVNLF